MPEVQKISPLQAEILLRKIDEGRVLIKDPIANAKIDIIRETIMDRTEGGRDKIPQEVREGKCRGCGGGVCANCGGDQRAAARAASELNNERGVVRLVANVLTPTAANNNASHHTSSVPDGEQKGPTLIRHIVDEMRQKDKDHGLPVEPKYVESLKSVYRTMDRLERENVEKYSPYQAEFLVRQIDQGLLGIKDSTRKAQLEQLREDIMDRTIGGREAIPDEVREGRCPGCGGGVCADCGGDQRAAAKGAAELGQERGSVLFHLNVKIA
jgi:hypothetical protein